MDNIANTFCKRCGQPKKSERTEYYDEKTGAPIYMIFCSASPFYHNEHDFRIITNKGFWQKIFGPYIRCIRCGETPVSYYD